MPGRASRTASNLERAVAIQSLARYLATRCVAALEHQSVQWPEMNEQTSFAGTHDIAPLLSLPSLRILRGMKKVTSAPNLQLELECFRITFRFPYFIRPNVRPFFFYLPAIWRIDGELGRFTHESLESELRSWICGMSLLHPLMVECATAMHRNMVRLIRELDPGILRFHFLPSSGPGDRAHRRVSYGSILWTVVDAEYMKITLETVEGYQADMILSRSVQYDPEMIRRCFLQRYPPRFFT
ncbi:SubName: Full=Uncharacterized protein {ECO:0000313/EMBL:CCA66704.1} [Serendipita indica DSM 11827]|uniref:Uncharacterized protein n=1 Tax=Serendipita indica (strain DSM 11827) TaxID=1109443 RepID=G4T5W1_SERID|nr:SubName: Full=Uncharacterized protein {ECO:0000313/EMBL:CCA66704.1} [Serendipita indica DSM 11827]CCA66704.1 hypothetical protein PIIN_00384 [Serendipita indica DSM 11827]